MKCAFGFRFDGDNKWITESSYMKSDMEIDCNIHNLCLKYLIVNGYEYGDCAHFWAYARQTQFR
jgi:hypothetical protein